jgi:Flp pilus assembly secretin CpaC
MCKLAGLLGCSLLFVAFSGIQLIGQDKSKEAPKKKRITIDGREYDGAIDIVVGQASLIAFEKDIGVAGKPVADIALDKPGIADFAVVHPRRLRILGLKAGVAVLTIKSKNGDYAYRLRVVGRDERDKVKRDRSFDGTLEIVAGQSRLMVLKRDLAERGKPPSTVALGDPEVADFDALDIRRLRVLGIKAGTTDLMIIENDGQFLHYEVRVFTPDQRAKVKHDRPFDGMLEIETGANRLVSFKERILGKEARVALTDPSIAEFTVVNAREIRVVGKKAGLTDLMIFNDDKKFFHHYEVKVTEKAK